MQLASSFSLFFSVSPQFFLDFSQQLLSSFKNRMKIQMFLTQMEQFSDHVTRKFGPLYFTCKQYFLNKNVDVGLGLDLGFVAILGKHMCECLKKLKVMCAYNRLQLTFFIFCSSVL